MHGATTVTNVFTGRFNIFFAVVLAVLVGKYFNLLIKYISKPETALVQCEDQSFEHVKIKNQKEVLLIPA